MSGVQPPPFAGAVFYCVLGSSLAFAGPALAHDWYVDGANGFQSNPGTHARPFEYFWQAEDVAQPGDTIYLEPTTVYSSLWVTTGGASGKPITIVGTGIAPNMTQVVGQGPNFGVWVGASYVTVRGLDVTTWGPYSGIHVADGQHNVTLTYNYVHDAGGDGIDVVGDDYVTISYNTVARNAKNTAGNIFNSGISIKGSLDIDSNTGTKMYIIGNVVYGNTNVPDCGGDAACLRSFRDSDGNGIILDNNRRTDLDNIWYKGRFLIANNVVFGNGGRGIHTYLSDHFTISDNSLYSNNQDPYEGNYRPGEITGDYVSDVLVANNIMYSDGGAGVYNGSSTGTHVPISFEYCTTGFGQITIENNLGYRPQNDPATSFLFAENNTISIVRSSNFWGNPSYMNASLNPSNADFRLRPYSRALGKGLASQSMPTDLLGAVRSTPTTIGAYENPAP
jgi:serralysin